tara:strand:+ start:4500 stop:4784 length:285 start_codon:yes stop_codon:yes gene_type:complete
MDSDAYFISFRYWVVLFDDLYRVHSADLWIDHLTHSITQHELFCHAAAFQVLEYSEQSFIIIWKGVPGSFRIDYTGWPILAIVETPCLIHPDII